MKWFEGKWKWLALLLILLIVWAVYTSNKIIATVAAVAATALIVFYKLTSPLWWVTAAFGWFISLFWATPQVQNLSLGLSQSGSGSQGPG